ncbi:DUF222 domain-containing protein [Nocardioides sp.]|uniref:HNH endonuclease signature motif containing protein n=1 Tax=Nocardioides sp. TaxID=35761 RepID=UPI0037833219
MATPTHRVSAATAQMRAVADSVADASVWSMGADECRSTLVELTRLKAQVAAIELRVAAHAEEVDANDPVAAWAHATRQTTKAARGQVKLARALDAHARTADALAAGRVNVDQARAIVQAVDELPAEAGPELAVRAEEHLLGLAKDHHAVALRILGRRLLEVVDPDAADAHEARKLKDEERDARAACRFNARFDDQGRLVGSFVLPHLHGAMLMKALQAFAAPKHHTNVDGAGAAERSLARPTPQRMGRALCDLLERLPANRLPQAGGVNATVVVTISLESLLGQLERAGVVLDTGHKISAAEARRLACQAGIIPAVLGGASQVLDMGRKRRFHTEPQRIAIMLRDGHCTHDGCDAPAWMCHVHHDGPWSAGGGTSVARGRLLCPRHHGQHHRTTEADPRFHPRT